jgi:hypothetical protein
LAYIRALRRVQRRCAPLCGNLIADRITNRTASATHLSKRGKPAV